MMHLMHGLKYWTCLPISLVNIINNTFVEPWEGILIKEEVSSTDGEAKGEALRLYPFDKNNFITPNNSIFVAPEELYETKQDAVAHYRKQCFDRAKKLMEEAAIFIDKVTLV